MTISSVTSEALQLKLRQLLPSQQGFGTDLSASNTIVPVIDLTAAAEGSDVPEYLQTALAFGSQTAFDVTNTTTTIINTTGFYRVFGTATTFSSTTARRTCSFSLSDGATDKTVWQMSQELNSVGTVISLLYDFTVFLSSGESLKAVSSAADANLIGSTRQVADINGTLVQPSGFTPQ